MGTIKLKNPRTCEELFDILRKECFVAGVPKIMEGMDISYIIFMPVYNERNVVGIACGKRGQRTDSLRTCLVPFEDVSAYVRGETKSGPELTYRRMKDALRSVLYIGDPIRKRAVNAKRAADAELAIKVKRLGL